MQVIHGGRILADGQATAEPADDLVWRDYYTRTPQIRVACTASDQPTQPETAAEITLDGNDIARLVECAIRHPTANMRYGVLAAIWSHPDSFRQIFRFGLSASQGLPEIAEIVAAELDKHSPAPELAASDRADPAARSLLPRMPLPAHLQGRKTR
jgi:hypothetical protein